MCVGNLTIIGSGNGLSAPNRYLNQCWNIVYWTPRNKLQWNVNLNSYILSQDNPFENVVWNMVAILSRPQCVNCSVYTTYLHLLHSDSVIAEQKQTRMYKFLFLSNFCHRYWMYGCCNRSWNISPVFHVFQMILVHAMYSDSFSLERRVDRLIVIRYATYDAGVSALATAICNKS